MRRCLTKGGGGSRERAFWRNEWPVQRQESLKESGGSGSDNDLAWWAHRKHEGEQSKDGVLSTLSPSCDVMDLFLLGSFLDLITKSKLLGVISTWVCNSIRVFLVLKLNLAYAKLCTFWRIFQVSKISLSYLSLATLHVLVTSFCVGFFMQQLSLSMNSYTAALFSPDPSLPLVWLRVVEGVWQQTGRSQECAGPGLESHWPGLESCLCNS